MILVKISILERDAGVYKAYFWRSNKRLYPGDHHWTGLKIDVKDSAGWAWKYITLAQFKQICAAFHHVQKFAWNVHDKFYQMRSTISNLNEASKRSFILTCNLTFDEAVLLAAARCVQCGNTTRTSPTRTELIYLSWPTIPQAMSTKSALAIRTCIFMFTKGQMCPVRQYNKDKSDPFRIDLFFLANHSPSNVNKVCTGYPNLDLYVYQRANAMKVVQQK